MLNEQFDEERRKLQFENQTLNNELDQCHQLLNKFRLDGEHYFTAFLFI